MLDSDREVEQRMVGIIDRNLIEENNIFTTEQYTGDESDVEDLFSKEFYLELVEDTYFREFIFHEDVDELDLDRTDFEHPRIVKEVEHFFQAWNVAEGKFSHNRPAKQLVDHRDEYEAQIPEEDKDRFEQLIRDINSVLED